jgi:hypothetical protein
MNSKKACSTMSRGNLRAESDHVPALAIVRIMCPICPSHETATGHEETVVRRCRMAGHDAMAAI